MNGETERLIPVAEAKTAQQQFQRAFAQEFLCPYDALVNRLQTERPTPEDIEEAAEHFGVSPLLIKTTLVNHGEMDRDSLKWVA
jgi:Zn-dependent peptidase ImmA (M78 family)